MSNLTAPARLRPPCPQPRPLPPAPRVAISAWQADQVIRAMRPHAEWFDMVRDRMRFAGMESDPAYWTVWHVCHAAEELRMRLLFRFWNNELPEADADAAHWCGEGI